MKLVQKCCVAMPFPFMITVTLTLIMRGNGIAAQHFWTSVMIFSSSNLVWFLITYIQDYLERSWGVLMRTIMMTIITKIMLTTMMRIGHPDKGRNQDWGVEEDQGRLQWSLGQCQPVIKCNQCYQCRQCYQCHQCCQVSSVSSVLSVSSMLSVSTWKVGINW